MLKDEARAFYGGLLGLQEVDKPDALKPKGGVWFSLDSGQLHVGLEDDFRPARKAHPAFALEGLGELMARLRAAGFESDAGEQIPGVRRCYVHDPFGNRIELVEHIG